MRTVITHFYNEEYLLPWWLNHHKKYFDHGIMIDYGSTDKSVEIIKEICPNWEIHNTKYEYFYAPWIEHEILEYFNLKIKLPIIIKITQKGKFCYI